MSDTSPSRINGMDVLHLTEDNKAQIRTLVMALTADQPVPPKKVEPAQDYADYNAMVAQIARRAFVPKLAAQIHQASPLMTSLLRQGAAKAVTGEHVPPNIKIMGVDVVFDPYLKHDEVLLETDAMGQERDHKRRLHEQMARLAKMYPPRKTKK